jgi:glycerophosphoryl diester phosphodiesterase
MGWLLLAASDGGETPLFLQNGVTAHRGHSSKYPGNTMPAFESALRIGCDWIEMDLQKTADDRLIILHDASTGRVGDQDLVAAESTYDELLAVDVAHAFREEHGLTLEECPPERIPLLRDVITWIKRQDQTRISVELKVREGRAAAELAEELDAVPWVGFNCDYLDYLEDALAVNPEFHCFLDQSGREPLPVNAARDAGVQGVIVDAGNITRAQVDAIAAGGLEPGAWTVNDEDVMRRLLRMGVKRIYTDRPLQLIAVLDETDD